MGKKAEFLLVTRVEMPNIPKLILAGTELCVGNSLQSRVC